MVRSGFSTHDPENHIARERKLMDFKRLYENADRRAADALISLWSNGNKPFQDYIRYLLSVEEPLLADPVFQSTFPWEPAKEKMADLQGLFRKEFIMALDKATGEYRFEKDRIPYVHQLKSWNALLMEKKSIIVTSGTGSGKTECFMIPVLHDLYEQSLNGNREGVGALFSTHLMHLWEASGTEYLPGQRR